MPVDYEPEQIKAPFTSAQVESLNHYQLSGTFHPFTCENCRERDQAHAMTLAKILGAERVVLNQRRLIATQDGWVCPTCGYTQDWAWEWMADRTWHQWASEHWLRITGNGHKDGDHG